MAFRTDHCLARKWFRLANASAVIRSMSVAKDPLVVDIGGFMVPPKMFSERNGKFAKAAGRNGQRGFSLIELLIVVLIILVIAAMSIPSFLRARISANESSAVSSARQINTAEATYASSWGAGYAPALANLGDPPSLLGGNGGRCVSD